ncbi:helix-turn-helix domain-containing protein [uncultured Vagococcus sp.]|uniref:helix-turn-helix domain-containing protein n=1 Tax=uncultured Vagococcus sp. TaxID=189676 RepID=UPI0028D2E8EE|nr:helix-turn-helix domain-containing protein [uncultured Vagococcus sp.]
MGQNLALIDMEDLRAILSEKVIKNEVWGTKEASNYLNVSISHLTKQSLAGNIPCVKIGSEWKYSSIALFEFVSNRGK